MRWFEDCQIVGLVHDCDWKTRAVALEETLRAVLGVIEGVTPTPEARLDVLSLSILDRARQFVGPPRQR